MKPILKFLKNYNYGVFWFFILALAALYFVYSTGLVTPYAHHDNTRHFKEFNGDSSFKNTCSNDNQWHWLIELGRPVAAVFECTIWVNAYHLEDLKIFKLTVLLLLAASALVFWRLASKGGMDKWSALFLGIALMTLPGMQHIIFMTAIQGGLSILLGLFAYHVLEKTSIAMGFRWMLAIFILLISFMGHQSLSLFFFVPTFLILLDLALKGARYQTLLVKVFRDFTVFGAASALYFMVVKLIIHGLFYTPEQLAPIPPEYRFNIDIWQLGDRIQMLFWQGVPSAFNAWNIYASPQQGGAFACVLVFLLFILLYLRTPEKTLVGKIGGVALRFSLLLATFLAANSIWLVGSFNYFLPRFIAAATAMCVILAVRCMLEFITILKNKKILPENDKNIFIVFAFLVMLYGARSANKVMTLNVWNNLQESRYISQLMAEGIKNKIRHFHFIIQKPTEVGYNGIKTVGDIINAKSATQPYELAALARISLLRLHLEKRFFIEDCTWGDVAACVAKRGHKGISITFSETDDPAPNWENSVIIDMHQLVVGL